MFEHLWRYLSLPMQLKIASQVCLYCLWSDILDRAQRGPIYIKRIAQRLAQKRIAAHWVEEPIGGNRAR